MASFEADRLAVRQCCHEPAEAYLCPAPRLRARSFGNGKTAIRGGYGVYYIQTLYGNWQNMVFQNPPNVRNITINTTSSNSNGISFDNPGVGVILANVPVTPYGKTPANSHSLRLATTASMCSEIWAPTSC